MWKNTSVAHPKIAIAMKNGTIVHPSSSGIDPVIGAPTRSPVRSRYLIAKISTSTTTSSAKNAVTAVTKKYRLSTSGARVEACSGNSGIPGSIPTGPSGPIESDSRQAFRREHASTTTSPSRAADRRGRLAQAHHHDVRPDEEHGQHPAQADEVHHEQAIPAALRVVVETVEEQLVDEAADAS